MQTPATIASTRRLIAGGFLSLILCGASQASDLASLNRSLRGAVLDYTNNHGCDRRIWAESLGIPRDVYVYRPPGYCPDRAYPLFLWIHGFGGDEEQFIRQVVRALDAAIVCGYMPPVIAVAPDVSVPSRWRPWRQGSWCINGRQGAWEDYLMHDVLGWVNSNFRILPDRDSHVIAGWSMGGFAAYRTGFRFPDQFRHLVGIYPNLNIRYADRNGHWGTDFDPETVGWLDKLRWTHFLGLYPRPYRFPIPCGIVLMPAWGEGVEGIARMSSENPVELLDELDIKNGQYDLYVAYGRQDEYNVDAQVESFLYRARQRGIEVWVRYNPNGHHSSPFVNECMPEVFEALGLRLRELASAE